MKYKNLNSDALDSFFSIGSKIIIFIPVLILILALVFKFNQSSNSITPTKNIATPTVKLTEKINFDLKGPYKCFYKNNTMALNAFVKDNNALVNVVQKDKVQKYVLKGDCVYVDGKKTCGLSTYISMATGFLSSNTSMTMVNSIVGQKIGGDIDIKAVLDSCQKEDFDISIIK